MLMCALCPRTCCVCAAGWPMPSAGCARCRISSGRPFTTASRRHHAGHACGARHHARRHARVRHARHAHLRALRAGLVQQPQWPVIAR